MVSGVKALSAGGSVPRSPEMVTTLLSTFVVTQQWQLNFAPIVSVKKDLKIIENN